MPVDLALLEQLLSESEQRAQNALGDESIDYQPPQMPYRQPGEVLPEFEEAQREKQARPATNPFLLLLDVLGATGYGVSGFAQGLIGFLKGENDPTVALTQAFQGLTTPITGNPATRFTMADTLGKLGWDPSSTIGRIARGTVGFTLDILTDPLTYTGFGVARHALKVGKIPLSGAGAKVAKRVMDILASKEGIQDLGQAVNRLQDFLTPWVVHGDLAARRTVEEASVIARAMKKIPTPEVLDDIMKNGMTKYLDKGGVKFAGRTVIRSKTADHAGILWDETIGKHVLDPAMDAVRKAGRFITKPAPVQKILKTMGSLREGVKNWFGEAFIPAYVAKDPAYQLMYRTYQKQLGYDAEVLSKVPFEDVIDPVKGTARSINPDEFKQLRKAAYDASYAADPKGLGSVEEAERIISSLPSHLQEKYRKIRTALDRSMEAGKEAGAEYGFHPYYMPQSYEKKARLPFTQIHREGIRPDEFDSFMQQRTHILPYDKLVEKGLNTDFLNVIRTRLGAEAWWIRTNAFVNDVAQTYGERFSRHAWKVSKRLSPEGQLLDDVVKQIEASEDIAGRPLTESGRLGEAMQLLRDGKLGDALDSVAKSKPQLPPAEIKRMMAEFRDAIRGPRAKAQELIDDVGPSDPTFEAFRSRLASYDSLLDRVDVLEKELTERNVNRLLDNAIRKTPGVDSDLFDVWGGKIREASAQIKKTGLDNLRLAYERARISGVGVGEAATAYWKGLQASTQPPKFQSRRGIPSLTTNELDRFKRDAVLLGIPEERASQVVGDLQTFGVSVHGAISEYERAARPYRSWLSGRKPTDDPITRELVTRSLDQMEGASRTIGELGEALTSKRQQFDDLMRDISDFPHPLTPAEAEEVFVRFKELQVMEQGNSLARRRLDSPAEIRNARRQLQDPESAAKALEPPGPIVDQVSAAGEIERTPIHPVQAAELKRLFAKAGLGDKARDVLRVVAGADSFEELSQEGARQILELSRRQPATLKAALKANVVDEMGTELVRIPPLRSIKIQLDGRTVPTSEVMVPANIGKALVQGLSHWRPGPLLRPILAATDRMREMFKWGVTAPHPGFIARNMIETGFKSATEIGAFGMLYPGMPKEFVKTLLGSTEPWRVGNYAISREALREGLAKRGIWRTMPSDLAERYGGAALGLVEDTWKKMAGVFAGTKDAEYIAGLNVHRFMDWLDKGPLKLGRKYLYSASNIENAAMLNFVGSRLMSGHTLDAALDAAEDVFFNFRHLTDLESNLLRRVLPFYGWMRAAVPYTWRMIKEHPGVPAALADLSQIGGNEAEFAPYVPDFVKNSLKVKLPGAKGEAPKFLMLNNIISLDWSREWATEDAPSFVRSILGQMDPLLTMPFEFALKKDFYFGGDIRDRQRLNRGLSEWTPLRGWLKAREVTIGKNQFTVVDGQRLWFFRSWMWGRLFSSLQTLSQKDLVPQDALMRLGTGIMVIRTDMDRQRDLLKERALRMQNDFYRSIRQGDDVRARQVLEELRGD